MLTFSFSGVRKVYLVDMLIRKSSGVLRCFSKMCLNVGSIGGRQASGQHFTYHPTRARKDTGPTEKMNLFQSVGSAMSLMLEQKSNSVVLGEDVAFGGVFRCSVGLREKFGE